MTSPSSDLGPGLEPGQELDGFLVQDVSRLDDLRAVACRLEHRASGARLLHLHAPDRENLFCVCFPTPPPDDSGVPHILEHSVLAGSRRFPVKEPFFEMARMSMATFLNALTGWECTYYPVASNVREDLFNLVDVYFDAVFYPLLTEDTFLREGHHLAPLRSDEPTGALTVNGIVYNEMKAAFSNPEMRLSRTSMRRLFPDTLYGRESGGEPEQIPNLTYTDFKRFYDTYYHPSNAYFFLYGDLPTADYTRFLGPRLAAFERRDIPREVVRQPRWTAPRRAEQTYPIGRDESSTERTYALLSWIVGDATQPEEVVTLDILGRMLVGHDAAPLKKAVIDSGLGQDLLPSGFFPLGLESLFSISLKGTEPQRADDFFDLVLRTLADTADRGFSAGAIEAARLQAAYHHLEILPMFPIHTMDRAISPWILGADPLSFLTMRTHFESVRRRIQDDPGLFPRLIRERLLDNPHRLATVLRPDREWTARSEAAFARRMQEVKDSLSDAERTRIAEQARELARKAATPSTPEALATLPRLSVAQLPAGPQHLPTRIEPLSGGAELLVNEVVTNGVAYLHLDFELEGLPEALWPYVSLYEDAFLKLGAAGMGYEEVARRRAHHTGGVTLEPQFLTHAVRPGRSVCSLGIAVKSLEETLEPALRLLGDLLFELDAGDFRRLEDVLVQARAAARTRLVHRGRQTASDHAARCLTPEAARASTVRGLPWLSLVERLVPRFAAEKEEIAAKLVAIRDFLLARGRLSASFTGAPDQIPVVRTALEGWLGRMRPEPAGTPPTSASFVPEPRREGLAAPIQVSHCAWVCPAPHYSHPDQPLVTLGAHILHHEYVLREVRLKGNAYGAWCVFDRFQQLFRFGSFADPHINETLRVFEDAADHVRRAEWTQEDVDKAIVAAAKTYHVPIRPEQATRTALTHRQLGLTPELREASYERTLRARLSDVKRALLDVLEAGSGKSAVCVVSSREKLEAANAGSPAVRLRVEDILA
ncbi:MAG: insulinase family protein [Candidatus Riflebacteria bacterium]|nr:insulinase family protein [Candidatus Riflebacteria bacterium]